MGHTLFLVYTKISVYDKNGNLIQVTDEDGYVTLYSYDPRKLIAAINYDNGAGKEASFAYNKAGELVEMIDWNGTTSFTLDPFGRITAVNNYGGNETLYSNDVVSNQVRIISTPITRKRFMSTTCWTG